MTEVNPNQFGSSLFREIHKNSWLTKFSSNESKKKKELVWTTFCVHDDAQAFLETYAAKKSALVHKPDWFISLNDTQHVSPTIYPHEQEFEFVITLKSEVIRLAASSWELMLDWVETLRVKLLDLRILSPKENIYSKLPETKGGPLLTTRDPTSPLPAPPSVPLNLPPGVEPISMEQTPDISANHIGTHPVLQRGMSLPEATPNPTERCASAEVSERNIFSFDFSDINNALTETSSANDVRNAHYEQVFQASSPASPGPSRRQIRVRRSNSSPRRLLPAPRPFRTLREQQVLELQKEIKHPSGVKLQIRRKDCVIALGDVMGAVWVCGWKQKEHPMLYNFLHIGDQLVSIEGIEVHSAVEAYKILRSTAYGLYVNVLIKRVPHGQVFVIKKDVEGQSLGIVQEGNTAVIQTVEPGSLAARHGLSAKAKTCDGLSLTNWVLTEINGRPLNLFFKENQVKDRLNSVGRDISILVQPLDLIKQLKKQLKATRNYKEYILQ